VNVALAEEIIGILLMNPETLDMSTFASIDGRQSFSVARLREWECGATACIAGHAAALTLPKTWVMTDGYARNSRGTIYRDIGRIGRIALGITPEQAYVLFSQTPDEMAVPALKYLAGNPDCTAADLREFVTADAE
jgi:hypothetical protein